MSESEGFDFAASRTDADWLGMARSARVALDHGRSGDTAELLRDLLVIGLNGDAYAIAVERVREIVRVRPLTRVPRAPEWLLGVVALRGEVVEIVDLGRRLGIPTADPSRARRIIVLHGDGDRVTGILVDSVSDVIRVKEGSILDADDMEFSSVVEMCQRGDEFISILDVDRFLGFPSE